MKCLGANNLFIDKQNIFLKQMYEVIEISIGNIEGIEQKIFLNLFKKKI